MIKIHEFEDFAKFCSIQEWMYIKEQLEDGERNFIDHITKNHKDFVTLWGLVGDFRHEHELLYKIYDPDGKEITEEQYYEILESIFKEFGMSFSDNYVKDRDEE